MSAETRLEMPTLFDPIGQESVADAVVHQIETMIVDGILKEGNRLPSERELAQLLQVSRPKLREALQTLEEQGLVQIRHGEGAFIAKLTGAAMSPAMLDLYARHGDAFFDYLEYRREQEAFAARLAAMRATDVDKERLRGIMDELQVSWDNQDQEASIEADFRFHSAIIDASQNSLLIHMMASIYDLTKSRIFYNRDFLRCVDDSGRLLLEQHLAIGDAILRGDEKAAAAAARAHIDFVEQTSRIGQERRSREIKAQKRHLQAR